MFKIKKDFDKIRELGVKLSTSSTLKESLGIISDTTRDIVGADRASVYIYNANANMLWSVHADGIEYIRVPMDRGVASYTFNKKESYITNSPYNDENFYSLIDEKSGYKTKSIASVPIFGFTGEITGVMQLLNKKEAEFCEDDVLVMKFLSNFVSGFLDLYMLTDDEMELEIETLNLSTPTN